MKSKIKYYARFKNKITGKVVLTGPWDDEDACVSEAIDLEILMNELSDGWFIQEYVQIVYG